MTCCGFRYPFRLGGAAPAGAGRAGGLLGLRLGETRRSGVVSGQNLSAGGGRWQLGALPAVQEDCASIGAEQRTVR